MTACTRPRPSSARSSTGRASRSCARRRSASSSAISTPEQVLERADALGKTEYAAYLRRRVSEMASRMLEVRPLGLDGVLEITPTRVRRRARLLLRNLERASAGARPGSTCVFVQDNHSLFGAQRACCAGCTTSCRPAPRTSWSGSCAARSSTSRSISATARRPSATGWRSKCRRRSGTSSWCRRASRTASSRSSRTPRSSTRSRDRYCARA